jgi:hypothetical protein
VSLSYNYVHNYDPERVQDVLEGRIWGRGAGYTFARLMVLLGHIQLSRPGTNYLFVAENQRYAKDVMRDFADILEYEGFSVTPNKPNFTKLFIGDKDHLVKTVSFIGPSSIDPHYLRGEYLDKVIIDVSPDMWWRYGRELEQLQLREKQDELSGEYDTVVHYRRS